MVKLLFIDRQKTPDAGGVVEDGEEENELFVVWAKPCHGAWCTIFVATHDRKWTQFLAHQINSEVGWFHAK